MTKARRITASFLRDDLGKALVRDRKTGALVRFDEPDHVADLNADFVTEDGRKVRSVLRLMAEKYLDPKYSPEAVAAETGIAAATIRGLASEIARVAFEEEIVVEQPWTDMKGEQHEVMIGRPGELSRHARHLRPFQWFSVGAGTACAADNHRLHRLPGRLSL